LRDDPNNGCEEDHPKGYGFSAVLVINRVSILAEFGHFGHTYMLFAGREVRIGKNCARGLDLSTARGRRPRAVLKIEGTVFPNTDRPRPANNVFIIFFRRVLCKQFLC